MLTLTISCEGARKDAVLYPYRNHSFRFLLHRKISFDEVFWMDNLCILVGVGKQLRQEAITQTSFISAGADNDLVIDPELQLVPGKIISEIQLRLQLACSPWMIAYLQQAGLARA